MKYLTAAIAAAAILVAANAAYAADDVQQLRASEARLATTVAYAERFAAHDRLVLRTRIEYVPLAPYIEEVIVRPNLAAHRDHLALMLNVLHRTRPRLAHVRLQILHAPLPFTNDFVTAVDVVQQTWPGSKPWLLACSSSEGGHGGFVMNRLGSGAGGNMQYMEGTFYSDFDAAVSYARDHGLTLPPPGARDWHSPFGQAYAAGYAYGHARPSGKWTGSRC